MANVETYMSAMVSDLTQKDLGFHAFVLDCFSRFLENDWGNVGEDDAEVNSENPLDALGSYDYGGETLWIKSDDYGDEKRVLTAMFPIEW